MVRKVTPYVQDPFIRHGRFCPPNLGRLIASLPGHLYHTNGNTGLYTTNKMTAALTAGEASLSMTTNYPWDGMVYLTVDSVPAVMTIRANPRVTGEIGKVAVQRRKDAVEQAVGQQR